MLPAEDQSPKLRQTNRERTRSAVIDAAVDLTRENGAAEFTMPEVAQRSGVSLRTLYRYFPQRQLLVDALASIADQATVGDAPATLAELEPWLIQAWQNLLSEEAFVRAQHGNAAGTEIRRKRIPLHRAITTEVIEQIAPGLAPQELSDIVELALLVTSSTALFEFVDVLDVEPERGARLATSAVAAMIEAAALRAERAKSDEETLS